MGDERGANRTLQAVALIAMESDQLEEARAVITPVVAWARGVSDDELVYPLFTLGEIALREGRFDEALALAQECLAITERLGDVFGIGGACLYIGIGLVYENRQAEAVPFLRRSIDIRRGLGAAYDVGIALYVVALMASATDPLAAARLIGWAEDRRRETGDALWEIPDGPRERASAVCVAELGAEGFAAARAEGGRLSLDEAAELALGILDA
jgi:hypothetical protein